MYTEYIYRTYVLNVSQSPSKILMYLMYFRDKIESNILNSLRKN